MAHFLNNPAGLGGFSSMTSVLRSANVDKSIIPHSKEGGSVHASYDADLGSTSRGVNPSWTASLENLDVKRRQEVVDRHMEDKGLAKKDTVVEGASLPSSSLSGSTLEHRDFTGTKRGNPPELHPPRRYQNDASTSSLSRTSVHVEGLSVDPSVPIVENGQSPLPVPRQCTPPIHGPPPGTEPSISGSTLEYRSFIGTKMPNLPELHPQRRYQNDTPISSFYHPSVQASLPIVDPRAPLSPAVEDKENGQSPRPLPRQYTPPIQGGTELTQTTLDIHYLYSSYSSVFRSQLTVYLWLSIKFYRASPPVKSHSFLRKKSVLLSNTISPSASSTNKTGTLISPQESHRRKDDKNEAESLTTNVDLEDQTVQIPSPRSQRGTAPWILASCTPFTPKQSMDTQLIAYHMANRRRRKTHESDASSTSSTPGGSLAGQSFSLMSSVFSRSHSDVSRPSIVEFSPTPVFQDEIPEELMRKMKLLPCHSDTSTSCNFFLMGTDRCRGSDFKEATPCLAKFHSALEIL